MTSEHSTTDQLLGPVFHRLDLLERRMAAVEGRLLQAPAPGGGGAPTAPVDAGAATPAQPPPPGVSSVSPWPPPEPPPPEASSMVPGPPPPSPSTSSGVDAWKVETVLKWVGVVLMTLAGLFLVSTAVSRGWIGPSLQLAGATAGGAGLVAVGLHLRPRFHSWAVALVNGGLVVLGICAGAAHGWLDLIPLNASLVLVAAVVGFGVALAGRLDHSVTVVTALALGLVVPGVIGAYEHYPVPAAAVWFLALVSVTAAVAARWRWATPRLVGLAVFGPLLVLAAVDSGDARVADAVTVMSAVALAAVVWWALPWLVPADTELGPVDHRLVIVIPPIVWISASALFADTDNQAVVLAAVVAAVFGTTIGLARFAGTLPGEAGSIRARLPAMPSMLLFSHLVGISSVISAGLGLWLDGSALLWALTVQAVGLTWLAAQTDDRLVEINAAAVGAIVVGWAAQGLARGIEEGLPAPDAIAYAAVLVGLVAAAALVLKRWLPVAQSLGVIAWLGLLAWLMAVIGPLPQGQMIVSILWAALGIGTVVVGMTTPSFLPPWWSEFPLHLRRLGLATLAATVGKLVSVDLSEVDTIWRAGLFALVGLGLLWLGFAGGVPERSGTPDAVTPGADNDGGSTVPPQLSQPAAPQPTPPRR